MKIISTIQELRSSQVGSCVLVPTMGALHEGHLALVRLGHQTGLPVTVSIFVNPTQFGANEDFSKYPRNLGRDAELLDQEGVSVIFAPSVEEMVSESGTTVSVRPLSEVYEGSIRPGHFDGVATIVCKLFNIVQPEVAVFGLKDLQQCMVIRKMTRDLCLPIQIFFAETIRESGGLAMSSRNEYLTPEKRLIASEISRQLVIGREKLIRGISPAEVLESGTQSLTDCGLDVDYFDLVNTESFSKISEPMESGAIITAVRAGTTRLIDNILMSPNRYMS